jgi:putative DNA methylase
LAQYGPNKRNKEQYVTYRKKLIEVAMPLEAINREAAREKSIRHGHPSTLHLWWARRPLAACRAVLFGQLVDDPSSVPEEFATVEEQDRERERLHRLIERLVPWEASTNEQVLNEARREIARSIARWRADRGETEAVDGKMRWEHPTPAEVSSYLVEYAPPVHDPFAGGGSIPLEAQRLGLRAIATDLNPVAVLINKALIEIPPLFAGMEPVNPEWRKKSEAERSLKVWRGAEGLAEDVRYYGKWMRDEAFKRIGHLYPKVKITEEMAKDREDLKRYVGRELTVIAWLWARTVKCPNPACGATMPLVSSYWLSKKQHRKAWVVPERGTRVVKFRVMTGDGIPPKPPKLGRGANFRCECCGQTAEDAYVKSEAVAGRMGQQLMSIVLEGDRERAYIDPIQDHEKTAAKAKPSWYPEQELPRNTRWFSPPLFGMKEYGDLFTSRQLVVLAEYSNLVSEAIAAGSTQCNAIAVFLGMAVSKLADYNSTLSAWSTSRSQAKTTFTRHAIPMVWDFAEVNPFGSAAGDYCVTIDGISKVISCLLVGPQSYAYQKEATTVNDECSVVTTDPPYYDNIGYADLADFFYVWLRRSIRGLFPDLFGTMLTPKEMELIATPHRERDNGQSPEDFFESGLRSTFCAIQDKQVAGQPMTLFYAFKQVETDDSSSAVSSTGWDKMLAALIAAGFTVEATWPMRTERGSRSIGIGTNALASSIVLTCRSRPEDSSIGTRSELIRELKKKLPAAVKRLQESSIAPVDLAQSAIGPGMAIFSRYAKVLEPDGSTMTVRTALGLINQVLDEILAAEEAEYDADTRWAITWFTQNGFNEAPYGEAVVLATARNTSVTGLERAGILAARSGKVRLLRRDELSDDWDPVADERFTIWEGCQHLIKRYQEGGEKAAAELLRRFPDAEPARELAYRLYQHCDRKGEAEEARAYNGLVVAWPRLLAAVKASQQGTDGDLNFEDPE